MAYGTATIPRVDKIVGPGNKYVAAAKARVSADCAIDFYAGPTEIVIVAGRRRTDARTAEWIAADLVAQAEHDPDARSILITWNARLAGAGGEARRGESRRAAESSSSRSPHTARILIAANAADAMALANSIAPEHLVVDREAPAARPISGGRGVRRPVHAPRQPATTRPVRTTSCRRRARRGSAAACRPPTSSA